MLAPLANGRMHRLRVAACLKDDPKRRDKEVRQSFVETFARRLKPPLPVYCESNNQHSKAVLSGADKQGKQCSALLFERVAEGSLGTRAACIARGTPVHQSGRGWTP